MSEKKARGLAARRANLMRFMQTKNTAECAENQSLTVSFAAYQSDGTLSKRYELGGDNKILKTPAAQMTTGTAQRVTLDFAEFGDVLAAADSKTAFGYGVHDEKFGERAKITLKGKEKEAKGIISRSQTFFSYRATPGMAMHYYDHDPRGRSITPDELHGILSGIIAGYADAATWHRGSVSAGVHRPGEQPQPGGGFHVYHPVLDACDIPRYGAALFKKLWLAG